MWAFALAGTLGGRCRSSSNSLALRGSKRKRNWIPIPNANGSIRQQYRCASHRRRSHASTVACCGKISGKSDQRAANANSQSSSTGGSNGESGHSTVQRDPNMKASSGAAAAPTEAPNSNPLIRSRSPSRNTDLDRCGRRYPAGFFVFVAHDSQRVHQRRTINVEQHGSGWAS